MVICSGDNCCPPDKERKLTVSLQDYCAPLTVISCRTCCRERLSSSLHAARYDTLTLLAPILHIQIDTIGMILQDLEKYQDHSYSVFLQDQVLDFVDGFGNNFLQLGAIVKISETMIKRILARQTLQADEFVKFQVFFIKSQ